MTTPREPFPPAQTRPLAELAAYQEGAIVSRVLVKQPAGSVTLFAFDAGQELSEHTTPFNALVQVLDGELDVTIGGTPHRVGPGEVILMPANVPHALRAPVRFRMLLTMLRLQP
jgi:quercetin dioxygenase-like cupin family protein